MRGELLWTNDLVSTNIFPNKEICETPKSIKKEIYSLSKQDEKLIMILKSQPEVNEAICPGSFSFSIWSPATDADIPKHEIICQEKYDQLMAGKPVNDCACNEKKSECQIPKEEINDIFNKPKKK